MAIDEKNYPLHTFYKDIYSKYDLVNRIFTFGQDKSWRKKAVAKCLENSPSKILDVCTGTGDLILEIADKADNEVKLSGYDFSVEMLQIAREKASKTEAQVDFLEGNVASMPYEDNSFDAAGISFGLRNLIYQNSDADKHLGEIHRVIKKGGRFVILESSKPGNPIWRFFNGIYLQLVLPYLGGIISGNLKAYKYLASSSKNYYTREQMSEILLRAGFNIESSKSLFLGSVMLMVVNKEG
jgi:demethylmenaquinone methyltransferase / 2-methoxy-6-polyprenyl-1,4-benzoquinol methylase